jgi:hypothetical protein
VLRCDFPVRYSGKGAPAFQVVFRLDNRLISLLAFFRCSKDDGVAIAVIGAFAGVYLFYRGFGLLQRKRLILNTPASKVRSAAMGLVEINGLAVGPYTITAPITAMPCFYFHTTAWQWQQQGRNKRWVKVADESMHVPFFLDDSTGRVLVNPQGAEMDIHRDFHDEFSMALFSSSLEMPVNISSFLLRNGVSTDKKIKIDEYCIKPKNALFVLGTLAQNPGLSVSPGSNLPGANSSAHVVGAEQQQKITAALMKAGITNSAAWAAAGLSSAVTATSNSASVGGGAAAARAQEQFDPHPSTVLMRGEHNPAFFISWRSQRDVVNSLSWKSTLMIWGGPALTLLSVYFMAVRFDWL